MLLQLADEDPERWLRVCLQIARFEGWECFFWPTKERDRECRHRVRKRITQQRSKHAPRNFEGDWLLLVLDEFPECDLAPLFVRRAAKAEARRELEVA